MGMTKNYKSSHSWKMLEAVVKKVLIRRLKGLTLSARGSVGGSVRGSLGGFSTWELRVLDLVSPGVLLIIVESSGTSTCSEPREDSKLVGALEPVGALRKAKVKMWMFKGVKAFSHVNFDEYICIALSEGLLIDGKENPMCVETLYGWVVGFDEVLVAESNMTKISKLKRWFSLEKNSSWEPWASPSEPGVVSMYLLKNRRRDDDVGLLELLVWRAVEPPSGRLLSCGGFYCWVQTQSHIGRMSKVD
ncbi:hypothetical protein Tco_0921948 [Tanacetum coccineum]|uniref:Uncharacterized protein n=1 Tax=Tanacetum coccineum TaxID=301880 RepID=A0ABQ5D369_9ASTR